MVIVIKEGVFRLITDEQSAKLILLGGHDQWFEILYLSPDGPEWFDGYGAECIRALQHNDMFWELEEWDA